MNETKRRKNPLLTGTWSSLSYPQQKALLFLRGDLDENIPNASTIQFLLRRGLVEPRSSRRWDEEQEVLVSWGSVFVGLSAEGWDLVRGRV